MALYEATVVCFGRTKWTEKCWRSNTLNHNDFVHLSTTIDITWIVDCDMFGFSSMKIHEENITNFGQWLSVGPETFVYPHSQFNPFQMKEMKLNIYEMDAIDVVAISVRCTTWQNSHKNQCRNVCECERVFTYHFAVRHRLSQVLFPIDQPIRWP